jgi:cytochrome b involved in lipid metabolism
MDDDGADLSAYPVDAPTDVTAAVRDARACLKAWPTYTLDDVSKHKTKDDCWIVVNDCVIDMTSHVRNHPGWSNGSKV